MKCIPIKIDLKKEYLVSRVEFFRAGGAGEDKRFGTLVTSLSSVAFAENGTQHPNKLSTISKTKDDLEAGDVVRFQWPDGFSKPTRYIRIQQTDESHATHWPSWRGLKVKMIKVYRASVKCQSN